MKNNTFNQIVNANLASIDPGFGQFALAKASADLFKKIINKLSKACPGRRHVYTTQGLAFHMERRPFCSGSTQAPPRIQPPPATAHTAPHAITHNSSCFT